VAGTPAPTAAGGAGGVAEPVPAAPGTTPAPLVPATPVPVAGDTTYRDGSYDGAAVRIRWGSVQVRVTIANGAIADVAALQLPTGDGHSADISWRVEPILRSAALASQSASIDVVSGATYTSLAYARSLQAALDAARA
jgi:uncharacterized protein with FMN-binding domain